jgi:hypothetical protein
MGWPTLLDLECPCKNSFSIAYAGEAPPYRPSARCRQIVWSIGWPLDSYQGGGSAGLFWFEPVRPVRFSAMRTSSLQLAVGSIACLRRESYVRTEEHAYGG